MSRPIPNGHSWPVILGRLSSILALALFVAVLINAVKP